MTEVEVYVREASSDEAGTSVCLYEIKEFLIDFCVVDKFYKIKKIKLIRNISHIKT